MSEPNTILAYCERESRLARSRPTPPADVRLAEIALIEAAHKLARPPNDGSARLLEDLGYLEEALAGLEKELTK